MWSLNRSQDLDEILLWRYTLLFPNPGGSSSSDGLPGNRPAHLHSGFLTRVWRIVPDFQAGSHQMWLCAHYSAAQRRPFWKGLADGYHGVQRQMRGMLIGYITGEVSQNTCFLSRILKINRYLLHVWVGEKNGCSS